MSDIEIRQIVKFTGEGCGKASVSLRVGPLVIHGARIMEKDGQRWLSMPSRKLPNGTWLDLVYLQSPELKAEAERLALQAFDALPSLEDEIAKAN